MGQLRSVSRVQFRRVVAVLTAIVVSVGSSGIGAQPAAAMPRAGDDGAVRVLRSSDGKLTLVCHYASNGELAYCDVYYG